MSRLVRGEKPVHVATCVTMFNPFAEPSLHKLVDVTCDDCGVKGITFDQRLPTGWTQRERVYGWSMRDLCPECSAKPEPPSDGIAFA